MTVHCIHCGESDTITFRIADQDFMCSHCDECFDGDDIAERIEGLKRLKMISDAAKLAAESVEV